MNQPNTTSSPDPLIALPDAPALLPNRPHVSAIWRWCRRGVLSRMGERIRLQHVRLGGKLYTSRAWIDAFAAALADADTAYFDRRDQQSPTPAESPRHRGTSRRKGRAEAPDRAEQQRRDEIERELEEEGL